MRACKLLPLLLVAAGCTADFTPRSVLEDLRVLAVAGVDYDAPATPRLDLVPGQRLTLTAYRVAPPGWTISGPLDDQGQPQAEELSWTFCPFSLGSRVGYVCAVPECELPPDLGVTPAPGDPPQVGVSASFDPGALLQRCLELVNAGGGPPAGVPTTIPDRVDFVFRLKIAARAPDGSSTLTREAVQLVPFYVNGLPALADAPGGHQAPNVPPVVTGIRIAGESLPVTGGAVTAVLRPSSLSVEVLLDPASRQRYLDSAGVEQTEDFTIAFFTTNGRFDYDRASALDDGQGHLAGGVVLNPEAIPAGTATVTVWAVASDLRGGETLAGPFTVTVGAP